jgi:hypothetical protein
MTAARWSGSCGVEFYIVAGRKLGTNANRYADCSRSFYELFLVLVGRRRIRARLRKRGISQYTRRSRI